MSSYNSQPRTPCSTKAQVAPQHCTLTDRDIDLFHGIHKKPLPIRSLSITSVRIAKNLKIPRLIQFHQQSFEQRKHIIVTALFEYQRYSIWCWFLYNKRYKWRCRITPHKAVRSVFIYWSLSLNENIVANKIKRISSRHLFYLRQTYTSPLSRYHFSILSAIYAAKRRTKNAVPQDSLCLVVTAMNC